jgi:transcriptional regulator with XRE-family HTH domain
MKIGDFKKRIVENKKEINSSLEKDIAYLIGNQIEVARIIKGFTQSELAKKVSTKQSSISRIESGSSLPSLSFLQKLADAFETQLIPPKFQCVEDVKQQYIDSYSSKFSANLYVQDYSQSVRAPYSFGFNATASHDARSNNTLIMA